MESLFPVMIFGFLAMAPAAIIAEKKVKFREILVIGIAFFGVSYLIIGFSSNLLFLLLVLLYSLLDLICTNQSCNHFSFKICKSSPKRNGLGFLTQLVMLEHF